MALNPYSKVAWQNAPSQATPVNATNLNKMDDQIADLTDHLINLNAGQLSYSNTTSELNGQTPQAAIDELAKPAFTEAGSRVNIASGEKLATILGKIKKYFADLKTVAFSGAYSDLSGQPTIGNGTLTIQKNGTSVGTFTANQTGNATLNITVPTNNNQLTNGAGYITSAGSCAYATSAGDVANSDGTILHRQPLSGPGYHGKVSAYCGSDGEFTFFTTGGSYGTCYAYSFTNQSSRRYKKNISDMTDEDALSLLKLRPVTFDYIKEDNGTDQKGFIAEDVAEIDDFTVSRNADGDPEGIDYSKFTPQLVKLCQIQQRQIDDLTKRIEALEGR